MGINHTSPQHHWDFSLALYARPRVETACLTLQNDIALDVNVLLVSLYWAGKLQRALEPALLRAADEEIELWRRNVVIPLRALRVGLKHGPPPAPSADTEVLRQMMKDAELQAERTAQDTLSTWFSRLALSPGVQPISQAMAMTANNVVDYYLSKPALSVESNKAASAEDWRKSSNVQTACPIPNNEDVRTIAELIAREAVKIYVADDR